MLVQAVGSLLLGAAVAYGATRARPRLFPDHALVWATGPAAALVGLLLARAVLDGGPAVVTLVIAVGVSAALVSLLARPAPTGVRHRVS